MGVAKLPNRQKPTLVVKQRAIAATGLSGVIGDSGRRQTVMTSGRPTGQQPRQSMPRRRRSDGINNVGLYPVGVGEGHSSAEAG
jgi:hypothetical protein